MNKYKNNALINHKKNRSYCKDCQIKNDEYYYDYNTNYHCCTMFILLIITRISKV